MPSQPRAAYLNAKIRQQFKEAKGETDEKQIEFLLSYGEVSLENIESQCRHIRKVFTDPTLFG